MQQLAHIPSSAAAQTTAGGSIHCLRVALVGPDIASCVRVFGVLTCHTLLHVTSCAGAWFSAPVAVVRLFDCLYANQSTSQCSWSFGSPRICLWVFVCYLALSVSVSVSLRSFPFLLLSLSLSLFLPLSLSLSPCLSVCIPCLWLLSAHCLSTSSSGCCYSRSLFLSACCPRMEPRQVGVSAKDGRGRTPVHYAAAGGDWENVQWLVAQGQSREAELYRAGSLSQYGVQVLLRTPRL